MTETLWLLLLIAVVGAGCYYAGWRSAIVTLHAALTVSKVTNAAVDNANRAGSALDKVAAETASLRASVEVNTQAIGTGQRNVEAALFDIYQGFERSGLIRKAGPGPGKQVGEERPEQS